MRKNLSSILSDQGDIREVSSFPNISQGLRASCWKTDPRKFYLGIHFYEIQIQFGQQFHIYWFVINRWIPTSSPTKVGFYGLGFLPISFSRRNMIHRRSRVAELAARRISNVPRAFVGRCVALIIFGYILVVQSGLQKLWGFLPSLHTIWAGMQLVPTDDVKDCIQQWLSPKQLKSWEYLFHDKFI